MPPLEVLRDVCASLTALGLVGMFWHIWLAATALHLQEWARPRRITIDDRDAIDSSVRNALYRLATKSLLTTFAATCWAVAAGLGIGWGGWGLIWLAVAQFTAVMGLLTAWSVHAWGAARARRRGPRTPSGLDVPSSG